MKIYKRKRLYAFPNAYGFTGFLLFLVIILAGGTYQNNLVFMMGFLVLSLGLIAILQTARNLRDLELVNLHIEPSYADGETVAWITLKNAADSIKLNVQVVLEGQDKKKLAVIQFDEIEGKGTCTQQVRLRLPLKRGKHHLRRLHVVTSYPYSLFKTWMYVKAPKEFLVYPKLAGRSELPRTQVSSGEDFSGYKTYEPTDSLKRVDWKVFSCRQELIVKEFNEGAQKKIIFEWAEIPGQDVETKLSQLTLWTDLAEKGGYDYQLILPQLSTSLSHGPQHLHYCLERLALHT